MNTLRGVFPEPKPTYKRNFIQENMRQLKHMQGIFNKVEVLKPPNKQLDRYQNVPSRVGSLTSQKKKSKQSLIQSASFPIDSPKQAISNKKIKKPLTNVSSIENAAVRAPKDPRSAVADLPDNKYRDMGVQTEVNQTKDTHKYPNRKIMPSAKTTQNMSGDFGSMIISNPHEEGTTSKPNPARAQDEKTNKDNVQPQVGQGKRTDFSKLPPGYQRGVVPKYLRDRKQSSETELKNKQILDPDCPPGHVTIPDAERKETLRALRQSYADLVAELNLMPVKTDTLRTRNRKIELEKQLNKIEEGIKVFSRPKVFVKINS